MPFDLYVLIVLTDFQQPFSNIILDDIFEIYWKKALLNVNILIPYHNESMLMTTYVPFKYGCSTLKRHDFGILHEEAYHLNKTFDEIYPRKASNLNNCPLIVSTFSSEPFVIVKDERNGDDIDVDGIDFWLLSRLAFDLNFRTRFVLSPDRQKRGRIYPNGTITGSMEMVSLT